MATLDSERRAFLDAHGEAFRLSREERDHVAGHALDSVVSEAADMAYRIERGESGSTQARKIAALSNLLGDIGWEREAEKPSTHFSEPKHLLGELFPVAQLRPWLEGWQRQDNEALAKADGALETLTHEKDEGPWNPAEAMEGIAETREAIVEGTGKLGTGAILLARIEKWMASHEN